MAICPIPPKVVPDRNTLQEADEGTHTGSWTRDAGVSYVEKQGRMVGWKAGEHRHLIIQCSSKKVQQGCGGPSSHTGLSQESSISQE